MSFKIKYSYRTGDSFNTYDNEDVLEYEWEHLEKAKEALKRIREHYDWYTYKESHGYNKKEVEKPKWHNVNSEHASLSGEHCLINIQMDNGAEVQFWPPWCGYFEKLYGAEIEGDTSMSFKI